MLINWSYANILHNQELYQARTSSNPRFNNVVADLLNLRVTRNYTWVREEGNMQSKGVVLVL